MTGKNRLPEVIKRPRPLSEEEREDPDKVVAYFGECAMAMEEAARRELAKMPTELRELTEKRSSELRQKLIRTPEWQLDEVYNREMALMIKEFDLAVLEYLTREWGKRS